MRNRYALLAISLGVLGLVVFLLFMAGAKSATLELSDIDKMVGVSNGKVYAMISDKLIEKELDGKAVRIVEPGIDSASLDPSKHQVFVTRTKNFNQTGKIISLSDSASKEYPNAAYIYWLGDNSLIQTKIIDSKKVVTTKIVPTNNPSKSVNIATVHDTPAVLEQSLVLLVETGPETDDEGTKTSHLIEQYDGSSLKKIKESVIDSEIGDVQNVAGQIFYTKQGTQYQLTKDLEENQIQELVLSKHLAASQNNKLINLAVENNKLTIWSYESGSFVKKGTIAVNKNDSAVYDIRYAVYDESSKRIVFQSGDSIYSFKFGGQL